MMKRSVIISLLLVSSLLLLSACGVSAQVVNRLPALLSHTSQAEPTPASQAQTALPDQAGADLLSIYEETLIKVYEKVNPSVVNITVLQGSIGSSSGFTPDNPFGQSLGSGFVWDAQGHIVTNNHVVEGASQIKVTFADGTTVPATLVGADAYSDLAVIKVDLPSGVQPLSLADSHQVKVGQLAIAIGNPFGLEGTMTVGIVSAIGRTLPASNSSLGAPTYSIPDIIQTDAPINPGNSGGVLVNVQGQVIGVTAAIESPVGTNAGIGFAIPSAIVQKVVPSLIEKGSYEHAWLGLSGITLTSELARAMNLPQNQRGVLVINVTPGSPAQKAGLRGSEQTTRIDGVSVPIGGDVITAIDGKAVASMDELISYLANHTSVGQTVTLTVLRDGKQISVQVTLGARPKN